MKSAQKAVSHKAGFEIGLNQRQLGGISYREKLTSASVRSSSPPHCWKYLSAVVKSSSCVYKPPASVCGRGGQRCQGLCSWSIFLIIQSTDSNIPFTHQTDSLSVGLTLGWTSCGSGLQYSYKIQCYVLAFTVVRIFFHFLHVSGAVCAIWSNV